MSLEEFEKTLPSPAEVLLASLQNVMRLPRGSGSGGSMRMRNFDSRIAQDFVCAFARAALGAGFLSAVADRFGLWGPHGAPNVAWGDITHFLAYAHILTSLFPYQASTILAWVATFAEVLFGLLLLLGVRIRATSLLSGFLLMSFGIAMAFASGPKAPLDASVFSAAAAAWLLSTQKPDRFTWDARITGNARG
jgi:uncharacterized membrane protein YphA (DoxX/SURF4 family)